jgi:hypothetical protein
MVMPAKKVQNVSERCPHWALPSRRWAWRATIGICLVVWAAIIGALVT